MRFSDRVSVVAGLIFLLACSPKDSASKSGAGAATMYTFAEPSLPLKDQPADAGKALAEIPFGTAVTVAEIGQKTETSGGKTGQWAKVVYQGKSGWVFTGFLSPIPFPNANCSNLLEYTRSTLAPEGAEAKTYDAGTSGPYTWHQKYKGNIYAEGHAGGEVRSMTLYIPVSDEEIGFHICRRCVPYFRAMTYERFKAQSSTIKECGGRTSKGGCFQLWFMEVSAAENGLSLKCGGDSI